MTARPLPPVSLTEGQVRLITTLQQERDRERAARQAAELRARQAEAKAARAMRLLALAQDRAKP